MTDKNINQQIDDALNSLDGAERATPGLYFFTRLQQRLNAGQNSFGSKIGLWISRPAIALSVLMVVILLNLAVIFNQPASSDNAEENTDYYSMASSNILDDENP